jgi:hypothetical protein
MNMKRWHDESEGFSNINKKQTQIHLIALVASITVLVLRLIASPYMIYALNTNSTPSVENNEYKDTNPIVLLDRRGSIMVIL